MFNSIRSRNAVKDDCEHYANGNRLTNIRDVFAKGILRGTSIRYEAFDSCGKLQVGSEGYSVLWNQLCETEKCHRLSFGVDIHAYRSRRAEVSHILRFGDVYKGKMRVGVDRHPDFKNTPSERLDVVLYDGEMNRLAKIASHDWRAGDIRRHIGDVSENAVLFCGAGGVHNCEFLYLAVAWYSDLHPYRFSPFRFSSVYHPYYFIRVDAPEALSDLMIGESFEAELVEEYGGFGLTRSGRNYKFADVPSRFGQSLSELIRTDYPDITIRCIAHGAVSDGETFIDMVEIDSRTEKEMDKLTLFRRDSGLDVRYGDEYETIYLPRVESPLAIPFSVIEVEYVTVPIPGRKNPSIEFRVNGLVMDSARYHDGQRMNGRSKYEFLKERVGMKSIWARLHYNEKDEPYLNVIWKCATQGDGADNPDGRDGQSPEKRSGER